uniref:Rapid ALkalinization Factor family protein n=1 Tax=Oryza punctata TaxID=4537 RepID=A0A0E0M6K3_ORYPU
MARRCILPLLLLLVLLTVAVATSSASAYADDGVTMMRRVLDDANVAAPAPAPAPGPAGAGNATTVAGNTTSGYISYDALFADRVPCSLRGASYYNCQPGAEANPYTRGCSAITQCRG